MKKWIESKRRVATPLKVLLRSFVSLFFLMKFEKKTKKWTSLEVEREDQILSETCQAKMRRIKRGYLRRESWYKDSLQSVLVRRER